MSELRYWILAIRTAGSVLGPASAPAKIEGTVARFATRLEAEAAAARMQAQIKSTNVNYAVQED